MSGSKALTESESGAISTTGLLTTISVGGTKLDNTEPSLSPDGTQVVFTRTPAGDSGRPAIWTAAAHGHLGEVRRRLTVGWGPRIDEESR